MSAINSALQSRLEGITPKIKELFTVSHAPGLSYAVIQNGQLVANAHLGFRDIAGQQVANNDTVYGIQSMTKGITAISVGQLVHRGLLEWRTPVHMVLPEFRCQTPSEGRLVTMLDLLSHQTGLTGFDNIALQSGNRFVVAQQDFLKVYASLRPAAGFRDSFVYNNYSYTVLAAVVEKLTGQSLPEYCDENIFKPLGMSRTTFTWPDRAVDSNVIRNYKTLADGRQYEVPSPFSQPGSTWEAGGGVKSTISDLSTLYTTILNALSDIEGRKQQLSATDHEKVSVLKEVRTIFASHNTRSAPTLLEASYAVGWYRTQMPGVLTTGANKFFTSNGPIAGQGAPSTLCLHHNGQMPGGTSVVLLLPAYNTAIIALHNGNGLSDASDWISQTLLEAALDANPRTDFVPIAQQGVKGLLAYQPAIQAELDRYTASRTLGTSVHDFAGTYQNDSRLFKIVVETASSSNSSLILKLQGLDSETFELRYYQPDVWRWDISYNELCRRGRVIVDFGSENYLLRFTRNEQGQVSGLTWWWDNRFGLDAPEAFKRVVTDPRPEPLVKTAGDEGRKARAGLIKVEQVPVVTQVDCSASEHRHDEQN